MGILTKIKNGYIEKSNENKYLTLVPTDERKDTLLVWSMSMKNYGSNWAVLAQIYSLKN